jgi:copper chaperone CopZ
MKAGKCLDQKTAAAALATKGKYGVGKFGAMAASTFVVGIEGMTCEVCAGKVSKSLAGVKGVGNIKVDVEKKNATITTKPGAVLAKADATKAVKAAGYKLTSFQKRTPKTSSGQYVLSVSGMT